MPFILVFRIVFELKRQVIYLIAKSRFKTILVRSSYILTELIIDIYFIGSFMVLFWSYFSLFYSVGKIKIFLVRSRVKKLKIKKRLAHRYPPFLFYQYSSFFFKILVVHLCFL